jgi:hypothetical protein
MRQLTFGFHTLLESSWAVVQLVVPRVVLISKGLVTLISLRNEISNDAKNTGYQTSRFIRIDFQAE